MTNWALDEEDDDEAEEPDDADEEPPPPANDEPPVPVEEEAVVPVPEVELPALTCWPTERSTEATWPAMVAVRVVSASELWAEVSWACDEATAAWSAATCVAEAPSS